VAGASIATIHDPFATGHFAIGAGRDDQTRRRRAGAANWERPGGNVTMPMIKMGCIRRSSPPTTRSRAIHDDGTLARRVYDRLDWNWRFPPMRRTPCGRRVEQPEKAHTYDAGPGVSASIFPAAPHQDRAGRRGASRGIDVGTAGVTKIS